MAVLDSVLSRILLVTERPSVASGLRLLEGCLKIDTNNPLILSIVLSCISALFVFLSMSSCQITSANCVAMSGVNLLPKVLDKIFYSLIFIEVPQITQKQQQSQQNVTNNSNSSPIQYSKVVKNLRQHATSLMVKLAHKYPLLLLPLFEQINTTIQDLIKCPNKLSKMEEITLIEALLLISNHFCDYERQTNFIGNIIRDGQRQWHELSLIMKTTIDFINFIGLNKEPIEDSHDIYADNRSRIIYSLNIILGIIKRCSWPDDPDRATRGGFVIGLTETGNPIFRNPSTSHIVPILPHILQLLKFLNNLYSPEQQNGFSNYYKNTLEMLEQEKKVLIGQTIIWHDPNENKNLLVKSGYEKMQKFLTLTFENCYHLMGSAGPSLGRDLYQLPGISEALVESVFSNLEHVPDYRLRIINRVFLKPFVYSCPPAYYEIVLLPIFAHLAPRSKSFFFVS